VSDNDTSEAVWIMPFCSITNLCNGIKANGEIWYVQAQEEPSLIEGWENKTSGSMEPAWFLDAPTAHFQGLANNNTSVDVVIVGAGISGMTTGYLLSRAGKTVAVMDDGNIGSGETGRTTAHITHALDERYYHIEKAHGKRGARIAAMSHTAAIDLIESIVREERIDCDFRRIDGYLFLDPTDDRKSLNKEVEATHRAGIMGTELLENAPIDSFDTGPCIRFPYQAQFQPLKYLAGLATAVTKRGGKIYTQTHVKDITSTGIKTENGYKVKTKKIVVATNAPIVDKISKIYDKQTAIRTYVIGARIKKGSVPIALYWDTGDQKSENLVPPYHYVRVQEIEDSEDHDLLIVGGEDHQTGNADDAEKRFKALESWTKRRFPVQRIEYRWSGQVLEPKDSIAFIGRNPKDNRKNIFIASGDSGNGMTHGTIAGIILTDLIVGKKNEWARLYNPARRVRSGGKKK
jgi:glycine/D-amino acid oxidase-like deaminating enzyme